MRSHNLLRRGTPPPNVLRVIVANTEDNLPVTMFGLAPAEQLSPKAKAMQDYLARLAAFHADLIFFSEACPEGGKLSPQILKLFPGYLGVQFSNNDSNLKKKDRHDDAALIRADRFPLRGKTIRVAGRTALHVVWSMNGAEVHGDFWHLFDRTKKDRDDQGRNIAERAMPLRHMVGGGDGNTIHHRAWQARVLSSIPVRYGVRMLPATEPGEEPPSIRLPWMPYAVSKVATALYGWVARKGSLAQRLSEMAEVRGGNGPLQTMQTEAGLSVVGDIEAPTKMFIGGIGVRIDQLVQKGMVPIGTEVIPSNGASDHAGLVGDFLLQFNTDE
jgi:hypothetical protein